MSDRPVLSARGLSKTFTGARGRVLAVRDASFDLPSGGSLGIVGESGSGKTTLARLLVGLDEPDTGTVVFDGADRARRQRGRRARLLRARQIQMVFQDPYISLDPRMTAEAAVRYALRLHGTKDPDVLRRRSAELLESVGLDAEHAASPPHRLSGGQRQRVAIARALATDSDVLVFDESVSALDVSVQAQILQLLNRLRQERQVAYVFVSHDLAVVETVTDDVMVLRHGETVEQGPTSRVLSRPRAAYTQMLLASVPRPGWDPESVARLRKELDQPAIGQIGHPDAMTGKGTGRSWS
jgi:ABC-type glutathione transport system ATPase component